MARLAVWRTVLFVLLVVLISFAAASAEAGERPARSIDLWRLPGAVAAVDRRETSFAQVRAGAIAFEPASRFTMPPDPGPLHVVGIWFCFPAAALPPDDTWSLESFRYLARATVYAIPRGVRDYETYTFGMRVPFAQRAVRRVQPTIALPPLAPGSNVYVKAEIDFDSVPLRAVNAAEIAREDDETVRDERVALVVLGCLLALGLANLIVFTSTHDATYAWYSASMLLLAVIAPMQANDIAWSVLWPWASIGDVQIRVPALTLLDPAISFIFTLSFLRIRSWAPRAYRRLATAATAFFAIVAIAELFPSRPVFGTDLLDVLMFVPPLVLAVNASLGFIAIRARMYGGAGIALAYSIAFLGAASHAVLSSLTNDASREWASLVAVGGRVIESLVLFGALAERFTLTQHEREREQRELAIAQAAALTDGLTNLANRRSFDGALSAEWRRAARARSQLALIMIDVDWFKSFNDSYGHLAGDVALRAVADVVRSVARRAGDLAARYGGEEFAVILPSSDAASAQLIAEEIRRGVSELQIPHRASPLGVLSVSAGITATYPHLGIEPSVVVDASDRALYDAKGEGRNRVHLGIPPEDSAVGY